MSFLTTDLYDANEGRVAVVEPMFRAYGGRARFAGQVVTLKVYEDNTRVREVLAEPGQGKILVVDGGGSKRCALLGDQIAELAVKNGWEGVVIYGCIRDSVAINALDIGVRALDTNPKKTVKRNEGQRDLVLAFGAVEFVPGHWLYVDEDGLLLSATPLL
ncbi:MULTISPECIES: ribonuclease E activity regulator RraA [Vogesella]|jgi:regulator of ribonuclease activity A|uniref:4-hydroxy-4-methyl-2-oxoglutarate aldolase n=1 Tax=Vogesella margarita TaxID=2984199 RepID=A0ABT5ILN0_9NEIS|nr:MULTISPECIES: ribonuclease E activity regulator RraA [Vogesella]MCQ4144700.1 ribonuclease E activity regulator RraA [Vogesella sp. AC12]MDC7704449.1 ribonuclease E activity regulator RraA [Vogesella indigofera]MDC7710595.1 ribonuclease E activity regulator RraA [Vogesella indigofera]MDC7713467.1 ribonuclease E activity regulator RraA [Vogesella margarita]